MTQAAPGKEKVTSDGGDLVSVREEHPSSWLLEDIYNLRGSWTGRWTCFSPRGTLRAFVLWCVCRQRGTSGNNSKRMIGDQAWGRKEGRKARQGA